MATIPSYRKKLTLSSRESVILQRYITLPVLFGCEINGEYTKTAKILNQERYADINACVNPFWFPVMMSLRNVSRGHTVLFSTTDAFAKLSVAQDFDPKDLDTSRLQTMHAILDEFYYRTPGVSILLDSLASEYIDEHNTHAFVSVVRSADAFRLLIRRCYYLASGTARLYVRSHNKDFQNY
jgi:hypothetical protein